MLNFLSSVILLLAPVFLVIFAYNPIAAYAAVCDNSYIDGMTAITDLSTGLYKGAEGGLYPDGSNVRPAQHEADGLAAMAEVVPRNSAGQPDPNGKIGLISIGMSNARNHFITFMDLVSNDPEVNSKLVVVQCAIGSHDALDWKNGESAWSACQNNLSAKGITPAQVQAAWMLHGIRDESLPDKSFPADAIFFKDTIREVVRMAKDRYPNLRLMYLSTRIYTGYSSTNRKEPVHYEFGFGNKWLIEDQINKDPLLSFHGPAPEAPWLAWGPELDLWANGLGPDKQSGGIPGRQDGLEWACGDYSGDGVHPVVSSTPGVGTHKSASRMLKFFKNDTTTCPWFTTGIDCPSEATPPPSPPPSPQPPPVDVVLPAVTRFSLQDRTVYEPAVFDWTVTDNQDLLRVELWQSPDRNDAPDPDSWQKVQEQQVSGTYAVGTFIHSPAVGLFWYGIHVVDKVGNCATEQNQDCVSGAANGQAPLAPIRVEKLMTGSPSPTCGNNTCEQGEGDWCPPCPPGQLTCPMGPCYLGTCPEDCPEPVRCGDKVCGPGEDDKLCPHDCPPPSPCTSPDVCTVAGACTGTVVPGKSCPSAKQVCCAPAPPPSCAQAGQICAQIPCCTGLTCTDVGATRLCQTSPPSSEDEQLACEGDPKGVWKQLPNACADRCQLYGELPVCIQVLTMGCDCGQGYCWNGSACVPSQGQDKVQPPSICAKVGEACAQTACCAGLTCAADGQSRVCQPIPQAPVCGNNHCDPQETRDSCRADCGDFQPQCGNGICEGGEGNATCARDCPSEWLDKSQSKSKKIHFKVNKFFKEEKIKKLTVKVIKTEGTKSEEIAEFICAVHPDTDECDVQVEGWMWEKIVKDKPDFLVKTDRHLSKRVTVSALNTGAPDRDGDGVPDHHESPTDDADKDGKPDQQDGDDDGDGINTRMEAGRDTDGDGVPDHKDADDDGDGAPTRQEDKNGNGNPSDDDDDGDSVPNSKESSKDDADKDGKPDQQDGDDDGDGINTRMEAGRDTDGDGVPDHKDADDNSNDVNVEVEASAGGDLNGDNRLDIHDYIIAKVYFHTAASAADLNGDGVVNAVDVSEILRNFGKRGDD